MSHIRIRRLVVKAFRSFRDEYTFEFNEGGLVLVRGTNHDANDSSGAGKTSLLEALAYAFDISQFPATEHQCWLTEEPMQVEVEFDTPQGTAVLKRGKVNSLKVGADKPLTGAKPIREAMAKLVGLSPDILRALVYRPQREPGLFVSMTDAKKKEFLTELLGLGVFETEAEAAQKRITALEKEADTAGALFASAQKSKPPRPAQPVLHDLDDTRLHELEDKLRLVTDRLPELEAKRRAAEDECNTVFLALDEEHGKAAAPLQEARDKLAKSRGVIAALAKTDEERKVDERLEYIAQCAAEAKSEWQNGVTLLELEVKKLRSTIQKAESAAAPKATLQTQLRKVEIDITTLRSATCPTCEREWQTGESKLLELEVEAGRLTDAIEKCLQHEEEAGQAHMALVSQESLLSAAKSSPQVPPELEEAREALLKARMDLYAQRTAAVATAEAEQRAKVAEYDAQLAQLAAHFREEEEALRSRFRPLLKRVDDGIAEVKATVGSLRVQVQAEAARLKAAADANRNYKLQYEQAVAVWEAALDRCHEAEMAFVDATRRLAAEKDFLACIGREGFLGLIFDDILGAISEETNRILAAVPNVSHITVRFESERETQDGKLRKEIRPVVLVNGRAVSLKAGLSGGMQAAVELAVDVALGTVVSERTGVFPGWLVLDEAFEGLGVNAKKACIDVLARAAQDRLILVVDHATEVREGFDKYIDIALKDGVSVVE